MPGTLLTWTDSYRWPTWSLLDRVICCYPNMDSLVSASARHATRFYALSYPRGTWWVRIPMLVLNLVYALPRKRFRGIRTQTRRRVGNSGGTGFQLSSQSHPFRLGASGLSPLAPPVSLALRHTASSTSMSIPSLSRPLLWVLGIWYI